MPVIVPYARLVFVASVLFFVSHNTKCYGAVVEEKDSNGDQLSEFDQTTDNDDVIQVPKYYYDRRALPSKEVPKITENVISKKSGLKIARQTLRSAFGITKKKSSRSLGSSSGDWESIQSNDSPVPSSRRKSLMSSFTGMFPYRRSSSSNSVESPPPQSKEDRLRELYFSEFDINRNPELILTELELQPSYDKLCEFTPFGVIGLGSRIATTSHSSVFHVADHPELVIKYEVACGRFDNESAGDSLDAEFRILKDIEHLGIAPKVFYLSKNSVPLAQFGSDKRPTKESVRKWPIQFGGRQILDENKIYEGAVKFDFNDAKLCLFKPVKFMVMEKIGMDLYVLAYEQNRSLSIQEIAILGSLMVRIVQRLHQEALVLHGDIHEGNVGFRSLEKDPMTVLKREYLAAIAGSRKGSKRGIMPLPKSVEEQLVLIDFGRSRPINNKKMDYPREQESSPLTVVATAAMSTKSRSPTIPFVPVEKRGLSHYLSTPWEMIKDEPYSQIDDLYRIIWLVAALVRIDTGENLSAYFKAIENDWERSFNFKMHGNIFADYGAIIHSDKVNNLLMKILSTIRSTAFNYRQPDYESIINDFDTIALTA